MLFRFYNLHIKCVEKHTLYWHHNINYYQTFHTCTYVHIVPTTTVVLEYKTYKNYVWLKYKPKI